MRSLAIIPARGGSKGIPGKNLALVCGMPMIHWTISAAREAGLSDVFVSTDDSQIAEVSRSLGASVPFMRPAELASDTAGTLPVIQHAVRALSHSGPVLLLQPTSPLRRAEDIRAALEIYAANPGRSVVSVAPAKPWLFSTFAGGMEPVTRLEKQRQGTSYVAPNGAIYIADAGQLLEGRDWYTNAVPYLMPASRSLDIDEPHELVIAEALMRAQPSKAGS